MNEYAVTPETLKIRQAWPLDLKVEWAKAKIREWVHYWGLDGVYVSFSGGKDSTVLYIWHVNCIQTLKPYLLTLDLNIQK